MNLVLLVRFRYIFLINCQISINFVHLAFQIALLGSLIAIALSESYVDISSDSDPSTIVRLYDPMVDMKVEQFVFKFFKYKKIAKCYQKGHCRNGKSQSFHKTKIRLSSNYLLKMWYV